MRYSKIFGIYVYYSVFIWSMLIIVGLFGYLYEYMVFFLSICIHEAGHILCAKIMGAEVESLTVHPMGVKANINRWEYIGCLKNIAILVSGPVINLLTALILYCIAVIYVPFFDSMCFIANANLILFFFNLLPFVPLDGGRIFDIVLSIKVGKANSFMINRILTICFSVILIVLGLFWSVEAIPRISMSVVGVLMAVTVCGETKRGKFMNLRELLYRKERFFKKGIYEVRELIAIKSINVSDLLGCLNRDKYHIINVVDEKLNIISRVTEEEVLNGILKKGIDVCIEELFE